MSPSSRTGGWTACGAVGRRRRGCPREPRRRAVRRSDAVEPECGCNLAHTLETRRAIRLRLPPLHLLPLHAQALSQPGLRETARSARLDQRRAYVRECVHEASMLRVSCRGNTGVVSGYPSRLQLRREVPQERRLLDDAVGRQLARCSKALITTSMT